jgi:hypothetical protein
VLVDDLAQAIFDASPSMADDLITVIDEWGAHMQASIAEGHYGPDTHPENPHLEAAFEERLARVEVLYTALSAIRFRD